VSVVQLSQWKPCFTWRSKRASICNFHIQSPIWVIVCVRDLYIMLSICRFRENRSREGHSFLMGINEITLYVHTVKPYDILQVSSTLVKFVYYIMKYIPYAISWNIWGPDQQTSTIWLTKPRPVYECNANSNYTRPFSTYKNSLAFSHMCSYTNHQFMLTYHGTHTASKQMNFQSSGI
jgi:hypothetical protein